MSTWRRRTARGIWPALLAYLLMSGLYAGHLHQEVASGGLLTAADAQIAADTPNGDCPLCVWHTCVSALSTTPSAAVAPPAHTIPITTSVALPVRHLGVISRGRGPPSDA
jgi:hypothetical protein